MASRPIYLQSKSPRVSKPMCAKRRVNADTCWKNTTLTAAHQSSIVGNQNACGSENLMDISSYCKLVHSDYCSIYSYNQTSRGIWHRKLCDFFIFFLSYSLSIHIYWNALEPLCTCLCLFFNYVYNIRSFVQINLQKNVGFHNLKSKSALNQGPSLFFYHSIFSFTWK